MGCATSHSEDLHKTSLLESDKFVNSLQDVPGYFNRTINTSDFLRPKFLDAEPEKTEMSYTGPPSHLRNSMDFHPYWHLLQQQDYMPSDAIHEEGFGEVPPSLLPSTATAQELRDIEVREAITDLRERVRETISSKLRENEEDYFAAISTRVDTHDPPHPERSATPPPLPEEDYLDAGAVDVVGADRDETDSPLAKDERETLDFLDSVINESMAREEVEAEHEEEEPESGNWSFVPSPPPGWRDPSDHDYPQNKPLPGVNLDITGSDKSSSTNPLTLIGKSIYLPENANSMSNGVRARQMDAGVDIKKRTSDTFKQITVPERGEEGTSGDIPKRRSVPPSPPKRTSSVVRTDSGVVHIVPPAPAERPPPPPPAATPPPPAPPSPVPQAEARPVRTNSRIRSNQESLTVITTRADVHNKQVPPPVDNAPPPPTGSPLLSEEPASGTPHPPQPHPPQPRPPQGTKSVDRRDSKKKAPVPIPPAKKAAVPAPQRTNPLDRGDLPQEDYPLPVKINASSLQKTNSLDRLSLPQEDYPLLVGLDASLQKTRSLDRRNLSPRTTPPLPAPRPKHGLPGVKPKPARHSMIDFPSETTILEDLPSDDSGIKEEVSEKNIHNIVKNLRLPDSSTLERKKGGKGPPPPPAKKPPRPVSMPPNMMSPPVVKPKPQRKVTANNGVIPNGRAVGRTASFGPARRTASDDASSEDSGFYMREDADILSHIHVGIPEGQVR